MNPLTIIAGVLLFVSGILLGRQSQSPEAQLFTTKKNSQASSPMPISEPNHALPPQEEPEQATQTPTKQPESANKNPKSITSGNLLDFKYPNSQATSDATNRIVFTSADSPQTITSWYEQRMKELGYSSRASAKTNTNGNVKNTLAGGKNNSTVTIEIVKNANEAVTTITLSEGRDSDSDVHIKIENNEPYL